MVCTLEKHNEKPLTPSPVRAASSTLTYGSQAERTFSPPHCVCRPGSVKDKPFGWPRCLIFFVVKIIACLLASIPASKDCYRLAHAGQINQSLDLARKVWIEGI
jgi:hypothetical protein